MRDVTCEDQTCKLDPPKDVKQVGGQVIQDLPIMSGGGQNGLIPEQGSYLLPIGNRSSLPSAPKKTRRKRRSIQTGGKVAKRRKVRKTVVRRKRRKPVGTKRMGGQIGGRRKRKTTKRKCAGRRK